MFWFALEPINFSKECRSFLNLSFSLHPSQSMLLHSWKNLTPTISVELICLESTVLSTMECLLRTWADLAGICRTSSFLITPLFPICFSLNAECPLLIGMMIRMIRSWINTSQYLKDLLLLRMWELIYRKWCLITKWTTKKLLKLFETQLLFLTIKLKSLQGQSQSLQNKRRYLEGIQKVDGIGLNQMTDEKDSLLRKLKLRNQKLKWILLILWICLNQKLPRGLQPPRFSKDWSCK